MEREVHEALRLGIDLVITATIISIIATFTFLSYSTYAIKNRQDSVRVNTETYSELYEYNNRAVSGSDVVDIIITYARVFDFEVDINGRIVTFDGVSESKNNIGVKLWSKDNITRELGDSVNGKFKSELLKSSDGELILGLRFTKEV